MSPQGKAKLNTPRWRERDVEPNLETRSHFRRGERGADLAKSLFENFAGS